MRSLFLDRIAMPVGPVLQALADADSEVSNLLDDLSAGRVDRETYTGAGYVLSVERDVGDEFQDMLSFSIEFNASGGTHAAGEHADGDEVELMIVLGSDECRTEPLMWLIIHTENSALADRFAQGRYPRLSDYTAVPAPLADVASALLIMPEVPIGETFDRWCRITTLEVALRHEAPPQPAAVHAGV